MKPTFLLLLLGLFVLVGCDSSKDEDRPATEDRIREVRIGNVAGTYVDDAFPRGGAAPAPDVSGAGWLVRGGSVVLSVSVPDDAEYLLVGLEGDFKGYYRIDLSAAASGMMQRGVVFDKAASSKAGKGIQLQSAKTQAPGASQSTFSLILTGSTDENYDELAIQLATRSGSEVSAVEVYTVTVIEGAAASDALQVSLNWQDPVDLDLHVETPDGEDIYYGNEIGTNGGVLDLDSNAACAIDGVNNENITWGEEKPAPGRYKVRVDYWSACDVERNVAFVVTTNVCGQVRTYQGTFRPEEEDFGGSHDGRLIAEFDVPQSCGR